MNLSENMQLALESLQANWTRTVLTLLGIVIGVGAVIVVVAIGRGGQHLVVEQIESLGNGLLWVESNWESEDTYGSLELMSEEDLQALAALPGVAAASPAQYERLEVRGGSLSRHFTTIGVAAQYETIRNLKLTAGRFFTPLDQIGASRTIVIEDRVREYFFGTESGVGQTLWLDGRPFTVIGELAPPTEFSGNLTGEGDTLLLPYTTLQRLTGEDKFRLVFVQPKHRELLAQLESDILALLAQRHAPDQFVTTSVDGLLAQIRQVTNILTAVVAAVAAIALIVGGIGIMNIMLVSVTERTREIGLRKALGARQKDIRQQFLVEAVVLTASGGVVGILLSSLLIYFASLLTGLPTLVTPSSVLLAFGFSTIIGIIFGVYPAGKAARLDPIEALRHQ